MVISDKVKSNVIQWLFPKVDSLLVVKSLSYCLNIQAFLSISQFIKHLYGVEIFFFQTDRRWFVFPALIKSYIPQSVNLCYCSTVFNCLLLLRCQHCMSFLQPQHDFATCLASALSGLRLMCTPYNSLAARYYQSQKSTWLIQQYVWA